MYCQPFFEQYSPGQSVDLALDLGFLRKHLKMEIDFTDEDDYLTLLTRAAMDYFESYTGVTLTTRPYTTYLDQFYSAFEIRKTPNVAITAFQYSVAGIFIPVPISNYYLSKKPHFSSLNLANAQAYPINADPIELPIQLQFTAGFGPDELSIPYDIREALMMHVANMYYNRGDCMDTASCGACANNFSMMVYNFYKIKKITGF